VILSLSNLVVGMTIYAVHAFNDPDKIKYSSIDELTAVHFPIPSSSGLANFIRVSRSKHIGVDLVNNTWKYSNCPVRHDERSLEDMGIIPNKYNLHQVFSTIEEAKHYIRLITGFDIVEPVPIISDYDRAMKILDLA